MFTIALLLILLYFVLKMRHFAPWVPTRSRDLDRIYRIANLTQSDICYDLGSGDGRVAFLLALSGGRVIGIEFFPILYALAQSRRLFMSEPRPSFLLQDIFHTDFSDATCIFVFGLPDTLRWGIVDKFQKTLKPGTRVISYAFQITGLELISEDRGEDGKELPVRVYRVR